MVTGYTVHSNFNCINRKAAQPAAGKEAYIMSFVIATDTSANLPSDWLTEKDIGVLPFSYYMNEKEYNCLDTNAFDGGAFYGDIRNGVRVTTSQVTPQSYVEHFRPFLENGEDVLFVGMSSGISGSYRCAEIAAEELKQAFPDRKLRLVDTLGASLGEGILVISAADCREKGMTVDETADFLLTERKKMCQVFTVDDLMHLRRGGRLSNMSAVIGVVLHIKPLLKGNEQGKIVTFEKVRGRKKSIEALAQRYDELVRNEGEQVVGIAHADCEQDAAYLAQLLQKNHPPKEILTVMYEPVTGSHVGPGALALFFLGDEDVRSK